MQKVRLDIGRQIIEKEEKLRQEARRQEEETKRHLRKEVDEGEYKKEENTVYVTGFDRQLAYIDLENYLQKYGTIKNVIRQTDNVRNNHMTLLIERKK